jgi:hypothetical protein
MLSAKCMSMKVSVSDVVMPHVNGHKLTGNERLLLQELRSASPQPAWAHGAKSRSRVFAPAKVYMIAQVSGVDLR